MSRSLLHDWEYNIERCCRENDPTEMKSIAEDIYNTAYARGKNQSIDVEEVLDKVRAEIADYQKEAIYSDDVIMTKRMILGIIDKYKGETEESDDKDN